MHRFLDGVGTASSHGAMWAFSADRWAIVFFASLLVVQTLRLWWASAAPRLRLEARRRRAREGEREAEGLLRAAGYRVEARQPRSVVTYGLDGEDVVVEVRADLLVRRGDRRFVAEVKTGAKATDLANRATRRQVLEYAHAFDVDGVLLVDADDGRVSLVRTPHRVTRGSKGGIAWSFTAGAALVLFALAVALR